MFDSSRPLSQVHPFLLFNVFNLINFFFNLSSFIFDFFFLFNQVSASLGTWYMVRELECTCRMLHFMNSVAIGPSTFPNCHWDEHHTWIPKSHWIAESSSAYSFSFFNIINFINFLFKFVLFLTLFCLSWYLSHEQGSNMPRSANFAVVRIQLSFVSNLVTILLITQIFNNNFWDVMQMICYL